MARPSWNQYYKELVVLTATRSSCNRLHVGCILVRDNRIISQGYNGFLTGCPHKSHIRDGHELATIHAEQNAIDDCAKRGVSCNNCEAYITHYPCLNCAKNLLQCGINKIYYIHDYNNDELVADFCLQMNCEIHKLPN
jgi:dCMP deaminase